MTNLRNVKMDRIVIGEELSSEGQIGFLSKLPDFDELITSNAEVTIRRNQNTDSYCIQIRTNKEFKNVKVTDRPSLIKSEEKEVVRLMNKLNGFLRNATAI